MGVSNACRPTRNAGSGEHARRLPLWNRVNERANEGGGYQEGGIARCKRGMTCRPIGSVASRNQIRRRGTRVLTGRRDKEKKKREGDFHE